MVLWFGEMRKRLILIVLIIAASVGKQGIAWQQVKTNQVLFICTGNYYRSRYAEYVFNYLAKKNGLDWHSVSRGLSAGETHQPPILAPAAIKDLQTKHIPFEMRMPVQMQVDDLNSSDEIIALYEAEHRPLIKAKFPGWESKVHYWNIPDSLAPEILPNIYSNTENLVKTLLKTSEIKNPRNQKK